MFQETFNRQQKNSEIVGGRKKDQKEVKKVKDLKNQKNLRKSKKGGSAFKSTLYSWSINPSDQKTLQQFSPGAVQYSPTSSKMVNNTVMFKPFKKGGRKNSKKKMRKVKKKRSRSKKGGSAFKSTLYSWSINPSDQKTLQQFSPGAVQYSPTSSKMVNNTVMFKPFKKGGRRRRSRSV